VKLALGTVQFGTSYGAFGDPAQVPVEEASSVLDRAFAAGIDTLDTAGAYGSAESVLGALRASDRFRIVTKIHTLANEADPVSGAEKSIEASLRSLKAQQLSGLMFHNAADILSPHGDDLWRVVEAARAQGLVGKIGASVYSPAEADAVLKRFEIDLVQLPFSVFDQRAATSGLLERLAARGVEVHVRSAFLQGFALSSLDSLPPHLAAYAPHLALFQGKAKEANLTPLEAAIGFALAQAGVDRVVVGVRSEKDLIEIIQSASRTWTFPDLSNCASNDLSFINPSQWTNHA
jgi:aryl-alcohol dehydrogenase-like predicted oxidoreductase